MRARLLALPLLTGLLAGCGGGTSASPARSTAAAEPTTPVPGVTLPADPLVGLVPTPAEVPGGMVPVLAGSGPRDLDVVAGYSGSGKAAAAADLRAHGFLGAYVAEYADPAGGRVLSVVASRFRTATGAAADLASDSRAVGGSVVPTATIGEASAVRLQPLPGTTAGQLVTVRFRSGVTTWLLAYGNRPTVDAQQAIDLARALLARQRA